MFRQGRFVRRSKLQCSVLLDEYMMKAHPNDVHGIFSTEFLIIGFYNENRRR